MLRHTLVAIFLFANLAVISTRLPSREVLAADRTLQVELHLAISSPSMRIGGPPILLRVSLWNKGESDFFAASYLGAITSAPAYMIIYVQNEKGERVPLEQMDAIMSSEAINDSWTRISPGHYYGTEFPLKTSVYRAIRSPGKYKIMAQYNSRGGLTPPSPDWSVPSHRVWKGRLESNAVWLEILPAKKALHSKR